MYIRITFCPTPGYIRKKDEYKIAMEQGELDTDYFYCVGHRDMTREDFMKGLRFIVSNNVLKIGSVFFRLYPRVAHHVAGIRFAHTIEAFGDWVVSSAHPMAGRFKKFYRFPLATHRLSLGATWQTLRDDRDALLDMFESYIEETFIAGRGCSHGERAPGRIRFRRGQLSAHGHRSGGRNDARRTLPSRRELRVRFPEFQTRRTMGSRAAPVPLQILAPKRALALPDGQLVHRIALLSGQS